MKSTTPKKPVQKPPVRKKRKKRISKKLILKNKLSAVIIAGSLTGASLIMSILILSLKPGEAPAALPPAGPPARPLALSTEQPPSAMSAEQVPAASRPSPSAAVPGPRTQASQTITAAVFVEQAPPVFIPDKPSQGQLVFVIDDAGNNLRELESFLNFPGPLTIAVLPGLPNSAEASRRIRAAGKEVLLHQPMESIAGHNPGPGAIFTGMEESEIRAIVNRNLDELWPVAGMNNHEGSRVTMDQRIMEIILDICRERGILFLDSRTTAETAAPAAARSLGIQIGERDVFLDNERNRDSITNSLNQGLGRARQNGSVVMIGHASTTELASLMAEFYPVWLDQGFSFSAVSDLMNGN